MKLKFKKSGIRRRILLGFMAIIFFSLLSSILTNSTLSESIKLVNNISKQVDPSLETIRELDFLITNNRMYATNWVYLPANVEDKERLKNIFENEYPATKDKLNSLKEFWSNSDQLLVDTIIQDFENLMTSVEVEIIDKLQTSDDYMFNQMDAGGFIDMTLIGSSNKVKGNLDRLYQSQVANSMSIKKEMLSSFDSLNLLIWAMASISAVAALLISVITAGTITKPMERLKTIINRLKQGEIQDKAEIKTKDEVGEMGRAVNELITGMQSYSEFADEIGKGNLEKQFEPLGENDTIGNSLIKMRENLQRIAEEDKQRNWITEGLAKFADILRNNTDNAEVFSYNVIHNLVKYLNINQGAIFLVNDGEGGSDAFLELKGAYAYERRKYMDAKFFQGEGLIGQAWQEGEFIYLTDVPDKYINISSGLGHSRPKSVMIVPLVMNEETYGVIELASFTDFREFEQEFILKISETIASTIATVKVNERTTKLLSESRELSESLKSQEEEIRQNMEELQATQEASEQQIKVLRDQVSSLKNENQKLQKEG